MTGKNPGGYDELAVINLVNNGVWDGRVCFPQDGKLLLLLVVPASLVAADQPAAMLYSHGAALLNGNSIARSSAIFSGDLIQTNADSAANINASGSIVLVLNDSLVQFQGNAVKLEHGGVTISTSKLLATRVGDVTVSPAASVWTEFEVRDVDGRVQIAARKGDLTLTDDTGTTTLPQGQQTTRDESQPQDEFTVAGRQ